MQLGGCIKMWLCPSCFSECTNELCTNCKQDILIEGRYCLKHCIKVVPRMCFEAWDQEEECLKYLYQGLDNCWYVVPSPDNLDVKAVEKEIQELNDALKNSTQGYIRNPFVKNNGLYMTEELLDPLNPNGESQFVIQLPEKRGWWSQEQSLRSWGSSSIHPAFTLTFVAFLFFG